MGKPDTEQGIAFSEAFPPSTFLNVLEHRSPAVIERLRLRQVRRAIYDGRSQAGDGGERRRGAVRRGGRSRRDARPRRRSAEVSEALASKIDAFVQAINQPTDSRTAEVDAQIVEQLRALGYVE